MPNHCLSAFRHEEKLVNANLQEELNMRDSKFYVDIMQDRTEVTGSFTIVVVKIDDNTIKFVVDCGMYQEKGYEDQNLSFPTNPENVDFAILTHNHVDHTGRFPFLVKRGFSGKIYTSNTTRMILGRALNDNARVLLDTSKRKSVKAYYDYEDVEKTLGIVEGCDYNKPIRVHENITITFIPNGHLIGAASVLVQIHCPGVSDDINLFFSGDYNNRNLFFRVSPLRKWITRLPINIIVESTYGNMCSDEIKEVFKKNILKALKEEKTVIIPVFSLGRAQEILYYVKEMQKHYSTAFDGIPIYYDGKLSFYYTGAYEVLQKEGLVHFYKEKREFLPQNLTFVMDKNLRRDLVKHDNCKVIITTSGMGSYGPAQTYIPAYIGRENALIHFTGYCAEGTLGYKLKHAEKGDIVEVGGVNAIKMAEVEFTGEFSAHSKSDELIKLLKKFERPLFVMVNHGRDDVKDVFAKRILKETSVEHVGILGRDYLYRVDETGFVKSITVKFL